MTEETWSAEASGRYELVSVNGDNLPTASSGSNALVIRPRSLRLSKDDTQCSTLNSRTTINE